MAATASVVAARAVSVMKMAAYDLRVRRFFSSFQSLLLDGKLLQLSLREHNRQPPSTTFMCLQAGMDFAVTYVSCFEICYNTGNKSFDHPVRFLYTCLCDLYDESPSRLSLCLWQAAQSI